MPGRREGRSQPGELRHRADPAADRAAELVLDTVPAHHRSALARRWAARRRRRRAGGAQKLEVGELAELRRQRAVQVIRPQCPATARGAASVPRGRGEYPSVSYGTRVPSAITVAAHHRRVSTRGVSAAPTGHADGLRGGGGAGPSAHSCSRSVSLPSSAGSVPSR
jgi:hypothetical protein